MEIEVRNIYYNQYGDIDCEINHPILGWIPFTASQNDPEEHGRLIFAALDERKVDENKYIPPEG